MIRNRLFALIGVFGLVFLGCNNSPELSQLDENAKEVTELTPAVDKPETTSVAPSKAIVESSPATAPADLTSEATPEEVCKRFMDLLRSGNRISAENLLTRSALAITTQAGLQLEPMGGPTAVYEIGEASFATIKNKIAQVECAIVEKVDNQEIRSSLTWLVRKQKPGWRISGLMVDYEGSESMDLLSFENALDVAKIKSLAGGEVDPGVETRQAENTSDTPTLK